jgi:hypothetical protein
MIQSKLISQSTGNYLPQLRTYAVKSPRQVVAELIVNDPGPVIFLGSCEEGGFLISDYIGYLEEYSVYDSQLRFQERDGQPRNVYICVDLLGGILSHD